MAISRENRAKQFMAFDALKGLKEALREKELEIEERKDLSEEIIAVISSTLIKVEEGNIIKIKYYINNKYVEIKSKIEKIDKSNRFLIMQNIKIFFDDIIEISIL